MNGEISEMFIKSTPGFRLTASDHAVSVSYSGRWADWAFWVPGSHMSILIKKR